METVLSCNAKCHSHLERFSANKIAVKYDGHSSCQRLLKLFYCRNKILTEDCVKSKTGTDFSLLDSLLEGGSIL